MRIHGTAVSLRGRGLLILGPSGAGKSTLGLQMMAYGSELVADDQVVIRALPDGVELSSPDPDAGLIEARGVGLLRARVVAAPLAVVVDLGQVETERLPPNRRYHLLGGGFPLVLGPFQPHLAQALHQLLLAGKLDPDG